jgi:hypothetical protein
MLFASSPSKIIPNSEFDAFCVLFARKYSVLQSWLRAQLTTKLPKRHLGPNGKHNLLLSNKGSFYAQDGYLSDSRDPNILWFQKSGSAEHLTKDL